MVLEGHVGCPTISGFCVRLDGGPALMDTCQFSKLIKKHRGMLDDGAICLCDGMRGPLYHLVYGSTQTVSSPSLGVVSFLLM